MKLYHGSKKKLSVIKKSQAEADENTEVPEDELLEAIYLTSDYGNALAMAARPDGVTYIDNKDHTIEFENPESFNPELTVYVHEINVVNNQVRQIDELQYVIENVDEIEPTTIHTHKAGDVEQYYELVNWKKEMSKESDAEFKIK